MTTSSLRARTGRPVPQTGPTGFAPARRLRRLAPVRLGVLLAVAAVVLPATVAEAGTTSNLATRASVSASSTAAGSSTSALTDRKWSPLARAEWTGGGKAIGSWVQLKWNRSTSVSEVRVTNGADASHRIGSGTLRFSDGSALQMTLRTDAPTTVVTFTPRAVTSLRFTVNALAAGATSGAISELEAYLSEESTAPEPNASGNVALESTVTASATDAGSTPGGLIDGGDMLPADFGKTWSTSAPAAGAWVQADWAKPREVSSVQVFGAAGAGQRVLSGRLEFSDGSSVPVGAIVRDPVLPTTVAFSPRSASWVRFVVTKGSGSGAWALSELRIFRVGATPWRPTNAAYLTGPMQSGASTASCDSGAREPVSGTVTVLCPTPNSVLDGSVRVAFLAPGWDSVAVSVLPGESTGAGSGATAEVEVPTGAGGYASTVVDVSNLPRGPVTVILRSHLGTAAGATTYLQLYNGGDATFAGPATPERSAVSSGRTLVYDEEFTRQVSLTRDGTYADYAAAKPTWAGAEDFGSAIFPDPKLGFDNMSVVEGRYLRIATQLNPPGYTDPLSWKRYRIGGMLASSRWGGSGFSAQYGYFETRMLAPAGKGTWPAFWMLPSDNLVGKTPVAAEIDAVELYGHDPVSTCHSTHQYSDGKDLATTRCVRPHASVAAAQTWHTYGVDVRATEIVYYVDGAEVVRLPQVQGGEKPLFFLVNLAMGGGWPIQMDNVLSRSALFVDYVRVYV